MLSGTSASASSRSANESGGASSWRRRHEQSASDRQMTTSERSMPSATAKADPMARRRSDRSPRASSTMKPLVSARRSRIIRSHEPVSAARMTSTAAAGCSIRLSERIGITAIVIAMDNMMHHSRRPRCIVHEGVKLDRLAAVRSRRQRRSRRRGATHPPSSLLFAEKSRVVCGGALDAPAETKVKVLRGVL